MMLALLNPDCVAGKHHACRGDAWNERDDMSTYCRCSCHLPIGQRPITPGMSGG